MPERPIGISFFPSAEAAAEGPRRAGLEGDVGEAFKLLSLRLPEVGSPRSIAPTELMTSLGSAGVKGNNSGFDPIQAVFKALLDAGSSGQQPTNPLNPLNPAMPAAPVVGPVGAGGSAPASGVGSSTPPAYNPTASSPLLPLIIGLGGTPSPIQFGGY